MADNLEAELDIINKRGLHARAAAKFVKVVEQQDAVVEVTKGDMEVDGQSIMGLLMLGASKGTKITVRVNGDNAQDVLTELTELVARKFDEE